MLLFGTTKLFDKDLDLVEKRGKDIQKLEQIIQSLVWEEGSSAQRKLEEPSGTAHRT